MRSLAIWDRLGIFATNALKVKILLVEYDESDPINLLAALINHRYGVDLADSAKTALELVKAYDYDLILIATFVSGNGIELCRKLREQKYQMPIVLLSANDSSCDRIVGLEAGADDYIIAPIDLSELIVRIKVLLRRRKDVLQSVLRWENLQLNLTTSEVTYNKTIVYLTPKEYGLLELFLRNPRQIFSRRTILDTVWNLDEFPGERAVNTQIKGLRQKLKAAGMAEDWLETLYGLGYRLKSAPNDKTKELLTPTQVEVSAAVAEIWDKFKHSLIEQLIVFEQAAAAIAAGSLDSNLRQQALEVAHRLIGTFGSFGLPEGSAIARQIEQQFQTETASGQIILDLLGELKQVVLTKKHSNLDTGDTPTSNSTAHLLVIDDDELLTKQIQTAASAWGFQVTIAHTLRAAKTIVARHHFEAILLDLTFPSANEDGFAFLEELTQQYPDLPVLAISGRDRLSDRITVARLGGRAYLQKPIALDLLLKAIVQVLPKPQNTGRHVMVVDDDPYLLTSLSNLLAMWGLQVTTLNNPQHFWETLEAVTPDLLILDVEMPYFNGIELCQVIRNDPHWGELPVLFLTAHTDAEIVKSVFAVGADDYATKPIVEPELVARVMNQLERTAMQQQLIATAMKLHLAKN